MNKEDLTELQKMQVAYAHFTLEEWKTLVEAMLCLEREGYASSETIKILAKFPSAVL
jgi:hypothetical protein